MVGPASGGWTAGTIVQPDGFQLGAGQTPVFCSPCHSALETSLASVAYGGGIFVAVGIAFPAPRAAAWYSRDGVRWQPASVPATAGTSLMDGVAYGPGGFVAVGGAGSSAAAWWSADGRTWVEEPVPAAAAGASATARAKGAASAPGSTGAPGAAHARGAARMNAVTAWRGGFVAGGQVRTTSGASIAEFWTSSDGRSWTAHSATGSGATGSYLDGGNVVALASTTSGLVAVGTVSSLDGVTGTSWTSRDGGEWIQAQDGGLASDRPLAVGSAGERIVAVGDTSDQSRAAAWWSIDGRRWTPARVAGDTNHGLRIEMTGLANAGTGFLAVGQRDSAGNGAAVAWTSPDGTAWTRLADDVSFEGAKMTAVAAGAAGIVAVGALGLPDNWAAASWEINLPLP